jgi:sulfonate transport system permease protein
VSQQTKSQQSASQQVAKSRRSRRARIDLLPWVLPVAIVAVWQLAVMQGWISSRYLPAPSAVLAAARRLALSGELLDSLLVSTGRAFAGLLVGGTLGFTLGLVNGLTPAAERWLDTSVQMARNVPHLALVPLVILWFGIEEQAKLFLVSLGVFFPMYINTFQGVRTVDRGLLEMARSYGMTSGQMFWRVILPGALPAVLVGLRLAMGTMWLTLIVAETIAAKGGIGYLAMNARDFMQTDVVLVAILIYALLGKLADVIVRLAERRLLRWHPAYQLKPAAD